MSSSCSSFPSKSFSIKEVLQIQKKSFLENKIIKMGIPIIISAHIKFGSVKK